jgi:Tfp pilus assembly protein PilO
VKTKNLAVGGLVGFLMLALWYNFLLKPTNAKVSKVKADTETERAKLQPLQAQVAQANIDASHADTFKARLAVLKHAVPDSPELANFIRDANDIAQASGITWQSVTHGPPTAGVGGPSTITLGIQVQGTYDQVLDYLARMAELKRLVVIDSVQFSPAGTTGAGAGGGAGAGASQSSGPFSGASTLAVSISARMFEVPLAGPTAVDGTTATGAATPPAGGATSGTSTLNNS